MCLKELLVLAPQCWACQCTIPHLLHRFVHQAQVRKLDKMFLTNFFFFYSSLRTTGQPSRKHRVEMPGPQTHAYFLQHQKPSTYRNTFVTIYEPTVTVRSLILHGLHQDHSCCYVNYKFGQVYSSCILQVWTNIF